MFVYDRMQLQETTEGFVDALADQWQVSLTLLSVGVFTDLSILFIVSIRWEGKSADFFRLNTHAQSKACSAVLPC